MLQGEVLNPEKFNKIATKTENLEILVEMALTLHNNIYTEFDELNYETKVPFSEYLFNTQQKIEKTIYESKLKEELKKPLSELNKVIDYLCNLKQFYFIHGDINFKNLLVKNNKITSLIDWDRSMIGPLSFEFAHISVLTERYGVSKWHKSFREEYFKRFKGDVEKLREEWHMAELFIYFKILRRKLTHDLQKNTQQICVETGEELKPHLIRKLKEHRLNA